MTFNSHLHIKQLNLIPQRWFYIWTHKIYQNGMLNANFTTIVGLFHFNWWMKLTKRTSYLATPCFENLKCLRTLLETIEFESTFICMTTHVINGLRNITKNSNSIVVQMDYVALLTSLLNTYFSTLCTWSLFDASSMYFMLLFVVNDKITSIMWPYFFPHCFSSKMPFLISLVTRFNTFIMKQLKKIYNVDTKILDIGFTNEMMEIENLKNGKEKNMWKNVNK